MKVYLTVEGLERIALGHQLYSWDYVVREEGEDPPKYSKLVGDFTASYPLPAECVHPVLAKLTEREAAIQAEAYKEVAELKQRKANLECITYEVPL